jgi:hypothetical protein
VVSVVVLSVAVGLLGYIAATNNDGGASVDTTTSTRRATTTTERASTTTRRTTTTRPRPTIVLTHPTTLVSILNAEARELMGRNIDETGAQAFIEQYHAMERANQEAAARGQTSYALDPRAAARDFILRNHSAEVGAHGFLDASNCLEDMVGIGDGSSGCS